MRKLLKKVMTIFTAGVLAVGAAALAACDGKFTPPAGMPGEGEAVSNGGFVVEKGDYVYFINGVESYTSDNSYGAPVKGALMRIKKADVESGENTAETVIPSLMVASDYTSGIYIYGERVYYATPSTVKNTSGATQNSYLDFKSAKLDGTGITSFFNVSDNATVYRFVEVEGTVYLLYVNDSDLRSYNTATGADTVLVQDMGEYVLYSGSAEDVKENPYVYYTMSVTAEIDNVDNNSVEQSYNQVYRVRADATEAPYEYEWNEEYLKEHDHEPPYVNLGEIVLDGIGSAYADDPTCFTHDLKDGVAPLSPTGFTYTLQSYANNGLYFTRSEVSVSESVGEDGWLYYLADEDVDNANWNSVSGNAREHLDVIAQDTTNAGTSAIFYYEGGAHHYLYVSNSNLFRADVSAQGDGIAETTLIAHNVGSATLVAIDDSNATYHYVYYTASGSTGYTVNRAVYNGTADDYKTLGYDENKPFRPVTVLNVEHARSWYNFEIVGGILYFANAETFGSATANYISAVNLKQNGTLMNNAELDAFNERFNEVVGEDGDIEKLNDENKANLGTAVRYYFYTGSTEQFAENVKEAQEKTGKEHTLYSEEDEKAFYEYAEGKHPLRSDFITDLGTKTDSDLDLIESYWQTTLQHYTEPAAEESGIPAWAWALIGVAIGVIVVGAGIAIFFLLRKDKEGGENKPTPIYVDTTDDRDVDVYADQSEPQPVEEAEEAPAEEAEASEEAPEEEAGADEEAPAETPEEADGGEAPSEAPAEAPQEAPAEEEQKPEE